MSARQLLTVARRRIIARVCIAIDVAVLAAEALIPGFRHAVGWAFVPVYVLGILGALLYLRGTRGRQ